MRIILIVLLFLVLVVSLPVSAQENDTTITLTLYRDRDSITLYVPADTRPITLTGLQFRITKPTGEVVVRQIDRDYMAFLGIPFDQVQSLSPLCFRLTNAESQGPVPGECLSAILITQNLSASDVFWYDAATGSEFLVTIWKDDVPIGICPSGQATCAIDLPICPRQQVFDFGDKPSPNAAGGFTQWLHIGEHLQVDHNVTCGGNYALRLRYANDNFDDQPTEVLAVRVDDIIVGRFSTLNTRGDLPHGDGWNVFEEVVQPVPLSAGQHRFEITVEGGDEVGIEIDFMRLDGPLTVDVPLVDIQLTGVSPVTDGICIAEIHVTAIGDGISGSLCVDNDEIIPDCNYRLENDSKPGLYRHFVTFGAPALRHDVWFQGTVTSNTISAMCSP